MGLSQIKDVDLENEKKSLDKLFECSDSFTSVVFNSGAGSGKTYALIECLKYIISIHHDNLKNHNQKIGCITYTNVAAEHIKQQLGVSDVVEISTIHERIWRIICSQKSALLSLHIEKLKSEVELLSNQLLSNSEYEKNKENSYKWQMKLEKCKGEFASKLLYKVVNEELEERIPRLPKYIFDGLDWIEKKLGGR